MDIQLLPEVFSIVKLLDISSIDLHNNFTFVAVTDNEISVVVQSDKVPENVITRDDGWKGFRLAGQFDFSLIGILARITEVLKEAEIGLFAISTYDTDYIFVKENDFTKALYALEQEGIKISE